ncbi:MAG: TetR/AcrR family transcriptional regulator [Gammaproteobacteria bacterium]|jgi:TetR/AcrR family fatty acid metabolism transcriptional regulator
MAPKIVDKEARRAEITRAATEVFAREGFQGASVEAIAEAAGVSKGTLYGYFENKEALFYATFQAFQGEVLSMCERAMAEHAGAWDKLAACFTAAIGPLERNIDLYPLTLEVWAAASSGPARERFGEHMKTLYREFREMDAALLDAGKASGEFRADLDSPAVAAWLVGGLDGLMLQYWFDRSVDIHGWTVSFLATVRRAIVNA